MSVEKENTSIGSYLLFPGIFLGAKAIGKVKRSGGINKAVEALKQESQDFKAFSDKLKSLDVDTYSRSKILQEQYDKLQTAQKKIYKATKSQTTNAQKIAQNNQIIQENTLAKNEVENLIKKDANALKNVAKGTKTTIAKDISNSITGQFKNKYTYIFMAPELYMELKNNIIPAFQEEGFSGGIKQVGKSLVKLGASLVSFVAGGSIGTALGRLAGLAIPGIGPAIGGFIGNMLGMSILGTVKDKIIGNALDKDKNTQKEEISPELVGTLDPNTITRAQAQEYQAQKLDTSF
ncbi:hypothetical protein IJ670_07555 [bacterium]|nr:hypothetical protein [bacterium]